MNIVFIKIVQALRLSANSDYCMTRNRKRALEDEGGTGRSPIAKKMREGSPSESHHSFSSRATYERDVDRLDKDR